MDRGTAVDIIRAAIRTETLLSVRSRGDVTARDLLHGIPDPFTVVVVDGLTFDHIGGPDPSGTIPIIDIDSVRHPALHLIDQSPYDKAMFINGAMDDGRLNTPFTGKARVTWA